MESVIVTDPDIMSGEPAFRGTRVMVRTLFEYIEAGHGLERFLEGFPTVSREIAVQALVIRALHTIEPGSVVRVGPH